MKSPITKVAFVSDVHLPYENKRQVKLMLGALSDYKPDHIILGGDIYDFYMISQYERDPSRRLTLQDEFDEGRYFIKEVDKLAPKVTFMAGNHENRLSKLLVANPGLYNLRALELPKAADLPSRWTYYPDQHHLKLGEMLFIHGNVRGTSERTVQPAMTIYKWLKHSFIGGHHHRFGKYLETGYDGTLHGGFMNGHLSDVSQAKYITHPNWQSGWTTFEFVQGSKLWNLDQHIIINNKVIANGKVYE